MEGRHGNSIRIGSRYLNPYIFISNNREFTNPSEGINDGSFIGMTSVGSISNHYPTTLDDDGADVNFILPSDTVNDEKVIIGGELYDYNYINNQIIQVSDKITICSKTDDIFLSSYGNTVLGSGNTIQIHSNNETIIESSNIYLGKQAKESANPEPLVLGNKITEILEDLVSLLQSFKVSGCVAGLSGPPEPATLKKIIDLQTKITGLTHLSEYHYIEDNGNKTE